MAHGDAEIGKRKNQDNGPMVGFDRNSGEQGGHGRISVVKWKVPSNPGIRPLRHPICPIRPITEQTAPVPSLFYNMPDIPPENAATAAVLPVSI